MRPPPAVVGQETPPEPEILDQRWSWDELAALAGMQDGLLSAEQMRALGVSDSTCHAWTRNSRIFAAAPRVYSLGHRALSPRGALRAELLSAGDDSALSHSSSLCFADIVDLDDPRIHLTVPRGSCGPRRAGVVVHRATHLDPRDIVVVQGLATTTVARSLIDLAGSVPESTLGFACRQAEYKRRLDVVEIGQTLARMNRPRGVRALRRVLAATGIDEAILETRLEERLLRQMLDGSLPMPLTQVWFDLRPEHKRVRVDFWYPDARLVVEADGPHHELPLQRAEDERRDVAFAGRGIEVVRVPYRAIDAGPVVAVAPIAAALTRRWSSKSTLR